MTNTNNTTSSHTDILELVTKITVAYVSNNNMSANELPELIKTVHSTILSLNEEVTIETAASPAVPIKKSYTNDHIICLEDGKKLKMLKRYLRSHYNMTPDQYREKWGLPSDYPMVAPAYAVKRSEFAKKIGLGKKR